MQEEHGKCRFDPVKLSQNNAPVKFSVVATNNVFFPCELSSKLRETWNISNTSRFLLHPYEYTVYFLRPTLVFRTLWGGEHTVLAVDRGRALKRSKQQTRVTAGPILVPRIGERGSAVVLVLATIILSRKQNPIGI